MKVTIRKISGIDDAINTMFISKRTWTPELEQNIYDVCSRVLDRNGFIAEDVCEDDYMQFSKWMDTLTKFGKKHITMLRYIDFSCTVQDLHRAGQDDWDAHAKRYDNRIIRSSTRLADFGYEMSDFYKGKIIPTDSALAILGIELPEKIDVMGYQYVKTINGYIREDLKDNKDVKRGLYMLSIPSTFAFKCNITEFAHVYKERGAHGTANPEVKQCAEQIVDILESKCKWFNRDLFMSIMNQQGDYYVIARLLY